jgi:hypothetical protein
MMALEPGLESEAILPSVIAWQTAGLLEHLSSQALFPC